MALPNSYNSYVTGFSAAQMILPAAAYAWTVTAISGAAYVNGFALPAPNQIQGGRYGGFKMNGGTALVVGCSGGYTVVNWDA